MSLSEYQKKRSFSKTPEPQGAKLKTPGDKLVFVVQKHHASHLHYDFRLEMKGMLKSWAVPKGPSINPADKRLAMLVEDHPFEYKDFEGIIPKGNYGAGTVIIWDQGTYEPAEPKTGKTEQEKTLLKQFFDGSLRIILKGKKLKGEFVLVQSKARAENAWLLMKKQDGFAKETDITASDKSVISGKTIEQISKDKKSKKWISNRTADGKLKPGTGDKPEETGSIRKNRAKEAVEESPSNTNLRQVAKEIVSSLELKQTGRMPARIEPMLATLADAAFDEPGWVYEVLWNGLRAVTSCNSGTVKINLENNSKEVKQFSSLYTALKEWEVNAILDGEIVVITKDGLSSLADLETWQSEDDGELLYYVFDILWLEGADLRALPLDQRREILGKLLPENGIIRMSENFEANGIEFYEAARKMKLDGIIAKKADSRYHSGTRTKEWLKIKSSKPRKKSELASTAAKAPSTPQNNARPKKPVKQKGLTFLNAKDETQTKLVNGHELKFTNLGKEYWPKEHITKRDMLNYYYEVLPYMLPYMKDRPQSLNRHPGGIYGESFYQKNVSGKVEPWITTHDYQNTSKEGNKTFLVCTDEASLLYIAKLGCIEMNPWHSRLSAPDNPDWCVVDLDPDTNSFEQVIEVANVVKKILDAIDVPCYPKTSGSTGMHLYIPLGAKYDYDQSKQLAELIVTLAHQELPGFTSVERNPAKRKGKIYLDFLQNRPIQTIAAPYSLRPKPGATASAPLLWEEVKVGLSIAKFNISNMLPRIKEKGDLFTGVLGEGIDLGKVLEKAASVFG